MLGLKLLLLLHVLHTSLCAVVLAIAAAAVVEDVLVRGRRPDLSPLAQIARRAMRPIWLHSFAHFARLVHREDVCELAVGGLRWALAFCWLGSAAEKPKLGLSPYQGKTDWKAPVSGTPV